MNYLQGQHRAFPQWSLRMYYQMIFSALEEIEVKSFALCWITWEARKCGDKLDSRYRAFVFFDEYMDYAWSKKVTKHEAISLLASETDIGTRYRSQKIVNDAINFLAVDCESRPEIQN